MNLETLLELTRAGWTRDDIFQLATGTPGENKPKSEPVTPDEKPTTVPEDPPAKETNQSLTADDVRAIVRDAVRDSFQAHAVATAEQPNTAKMSVQDALAGFLK